MATCPRPEPVELVEFDDAEDTDPDFEFDVMDDELDPLSESAMQRARERRARNL